MTREPPTEPTSEDVARLAKVSRQTVNRALGGYGYVGAESARKVREAAAALGYRPNAAARALLTGRSRSLGVVCVDIANPFFAGVVAGMCEVAMREGYEPLITNSGGDLAQERAAVEALLAKRVDGLIVAPIDVGAADHLRAVVSSGMPLVVIDRVPPGLAADSVSIDNVAAGLEVTLELLGSGHRRIGIVVHLQGDEARWESWDVDATDLPGMLNPSAARLLGYLRAHVAAGAPVDPALVRATTTQERSEGERAAAALMALPSPPTALFATDDVLSVGVYARIREAGPRVPEDLALVVFDDLDWTGLTTPALSVVAQPFRAMGEQAAELLLERVSRSHEGRPRAVVLPHRLVLRESTRGPA